MILGSWHKQMMVRNLFVRELNCWLNMAQIYKGPMLILLLIGGDKKGKDEKLFYKTLIKEAEKIYEKYCDEKLSGGEDG